MTCLLPHGNKKLNKKMKTKKGSKKINKRSKRTKKISKISDKICVSVNSSGKVFLKTSNP